MAIIANHIESDALTVPSVTDSPELVHAFTELLLRLDLEDRASRQKICKESIKQADKLLTRRSYKEAQSKYRQAITVVVGDTFVVPIPQTENGGVISGVYLRLTMDERVSLMTCCNGMAQCLDKVHKTQEALDWFHEVDVLHKHTRFLTRPALFDWMVSHPDPLRLDFFIQRITGLSCASSIFLRLGNTACAAQRAVVGDEVIMSLPTHVDPRPLRELLPAAVMRTLTQYRHPDPGLLAQTTLSQESLQVRGSWQKVKLARGPGISHRSNFASFVYKSRLYVAGGQNCGTTEEYNDLWCIDLQKLDRWRQLPAYPFGRRIDVISWNMVVHNDKAYCLDAMPTLDYFDLASENWVRLRTPVVGPDGRLAPWPYRGCLTPEYAMEVVNGQLFIFAGALSPNRMLGTDLLFVLDFRTMRMTQLAGTTGEPQADYRHPGPRMNIGSWVDARQDKLHFMGGMADRIAALGDGVSDPPPSEKPHAYDDIWSWDIRARGWRREKMLGNVPCPRAEHACTYNPGLDATVVFGGYNPEVPTISAAATRGFAFGYYADTFVLEHASSPAPRWRQVLTRGFPTYRAGAHMHTDTDTGRMFLFGGYTNTEFVPSGKHEMTRSFGDLWQLRLDVPGGFFEEVDWEDEERTAHVGPWHKCFACGSTGPWKKCAGTCRGRAFFCDAGCLKDGWKEHKEKHGCAKR
ncbi:hypothetical protein B0H21DRAFT_758865 [Amylocystis lapponica]|nr:hypothetical protein B0H21DRAFT_758865 [Amylocystis lapponica]